MSIPDGSNGSRPDRHSSTPGVVYIPDTYHLRPEIIATGPLGTLLAWSAWGYCARNLTDGFIPAAEVGSIAPGLDAVAGAALAAQFVAAGIWEAVPGGYRIPEYLAGNPTRAEVERAQRRQAE